jgi:hypothetical protein
MTKKCHPERSRGICLFSRHKAINHYSIINNHLEVDKKGKKRRSFGQVWRRLGAVWRHIGQVWRRFGLLWQQKNTKKPHFDIKNQENTKFPRLIPTK